jgi:hypothetical protein
MLINIQFFKNEKVLKSIIFWDITPCNPLKVNRRFGGTSPSPSGPKNKMNKIQALKKVARRKKPQILQEDIIEGFRYKRIKF